VVSSALALADKEGLDAVTIRRLAADLRVTPMALYWHFEDKERLLDGIAERILSSIDIGSPQQATGVWHEQLAAVLSALLEQLRAHPAVAELIHTRILLSEAGLQVTERVLGLLQGAGFSPVMAGQLGVAALSSMIQLVANEPGLYVGADQAEKEQAIRSKKARLHELSPQKYPAVLSSMDALFDCDDTRNYFAMGVDLFIAGVRHLQSAAS
jgi:TetR/AcrR family transcriptional regulator, tetracycline repressor protein